jgi:hypothetical protein
LFLPYRITKTSTAIAKLINQAVALNFFRVFWFRIYAVHQLFKSIAAFVGRRSDQVVVRKRGVLLYVLCIVLEHETKY